MCLNGINNVKYRISYHMIFFALDYLKTQTWKYTKTYQRIVSINIFPFVNWFRNHLYNMSNTYAFINRNGFYKYSLY